MPLDSVRSTADPVLVEACVDSVESAQAAERGGARRVELCANLLEGGTTPSTATIELCRERLEIPVFVIIRPRGGDFLYSDTEIEVMRRDIAGAARAGAAGVVVGVLRRDGSVDAERMRPLVEAARPLAVTFHRAFDVTRDADEALDALLALGVDRVLTSGRAVTAEAGIPVIARLVERSAGRLVVLAGGGVREHNVERIVRETGVREVHVRDRSPRQSSMAYRNPEVDFGAVVEGTDAARIAAIVRAAGGGTYREKREGAQD